MSIRVEDVLKRARLILRQPDKNNSNWTNDDLLVFLNSALDTLPQSLRMKRKTIEIQGTGSGKYPLPSDCLIVERVERNLWDMEFVPFGALNVVDFDAGITRGNGYIYSVHDDELWVSPSLNTNAFLHYQAIIPDVVSDDGVIDAAVVVRQPLVYSIVADALTQIGDPMAATYQGKFFEAVKQAEATELLRQLPINSKVQTPSPRL
jgi:hypothetical protein